MVSVGICRGIKAISGSCEYVNQEQSGQYGRRLLTVGNMSSRTDRAEPLLAIKRASTLREVEICQVCPEPHRQVTSWLVSLIANCDKRPSHTLASSFLYH